MHELLLDPDAFARRRADDPSLSGPAPVALLAGLASVLSERSTMRQAASVVGVALTVALPVALSILWTVYSLL